MAEREISVQMSSTYKSDLSKKLRQDKQKIEEFEKFLQRRPLNIPVKLDLRGAMTQAAALRKAILGEFARMPASILGADGRPASAATSSGARMNASAGRLSTTEVHRLDKDGKMVLDQVHTVEQLGRGLSEINKFKGAASTPFETITKDISNVKALDDRLRGMNEGLRQSYNVAKGKGDKTGQIAALNQQLSLVQQVKREIEQAGLSHSPTHTKAQSQITGLQDKIETLHGRGLTATERSARQERSRQVGQQIADEYRASQASLKSNKIDEAAAKSLPDRAAREAELNRVYAERKRIFEQSRDRFRGMDASLQSEGRPDLATKAMAAGRVQHNQVNQEDVDQARRSSQRIQTDAAAAAKQLADEEKARQQHGAANLKADVDRGIAAEKARKKQQEDEEKARQKHGSSNLKADVDKARAARQAGLNQELQDIKAASEKRIAAINSLERREKNAAGKSVQLQEQAASRAHQARQKEFGARSASYGDVENRARSTQHNTVADSARGKRLGSEVAAARDLEKFSAASAKSGHALDFHSSSLLRNAATFLKWQIPMQAVMAITKSFSSGFDGAVKVNRQFATLRSVFNGTEEDAQKLKIGTLELASAQGRSAEEAMDASIRWSRLGFTRVQVLQATKVSLQAANVAEISAADASEKLSAIYATFRLNVGDLGTVLNRLNSISNNYNVTVDDMFEGIVRVGGVAKQSGLALRDLEGIIGAVVGATGRPGAEVGNALKFVITRLASPETMAALKKSFNIDLTEPNGDLKDMSQIFKQLADIYPTLNSAQQQYFLKLTAGSRQAARFALILDQYRTGQILAAGAAFDTSSAFSENQKIVESLQSRIESLKSSWTNLFTAMGDTGAFSRIGGFLRYVQGQVEGIKGALPEGQGASSKDVVVNNPVMAKTIERLGSGGAKAFSTADSFDKSDVDSTIEVLRKQIDERAKKGPSVLDTLASGQTPMGADERKKYNIPEPQFRVAGAKFGEGIIYKNLDEARKILAAMEALRSAGGDTGAQDEVGKMTAGVNSTRERLGGLERASGVFDSMEKGISNGSMDRKTMIKDFEQIAALLPNMEDGTDLYTDSISRFYKMLESGDLKGIAKLMGELSGKFQDATKLTRANYLQQREPVLQALRDRQIDIAKRQKEAMMMPHGNAQEHADRNSAIKKTGDESKVTSSALEQLTQEMEAFNKLAFSDEQVSNISKYLDDVLAQAAAVGESMKELAPDAANDPVDRIFQRKRNAHGKDKKGKNDSNLGLEWLDEIRKQTEEESVKRKVPAAAAIESAKARIAENEAALHPLQQMRKNHPNPNPGSPVDAEIKDRSAAIAAANVEVAAQEKIIKTQDEANQIIKTRIDAEEKRLEQLQRELDFQEQIAKLARIQTDSSKHTANSSRAWRFGDTESDKDANEAQMAMKRAAGGINSAWDSRNSTTPADKAKIKGQVVQDEATARTNLESMERRNFDLDAARRQVAFDTLKAMREQTEEASKRLMLASREDQLRASALARTIRDKGPVKSKEFFALSQETRQAMVNYNPNAAPDFLNPAKETGRKATRDINEEQTRLHDNISKLDRWMEALAKRITADTDKGGSLDSTPPAPAQPIQSAAGNATRDGAPVVNLSLGDINISIKLSEQVDKILTGYVDQKLNTDLAAMEQRLRTRPAPNSQGATER